jgi:hypothetical protein
MNLLDNTNDLTDILGHFHRKGVRLWSEDGRLRYKAPKGALGHEDVEKLRVCGRQILALLEKSSIAQRDMRTLMPRSQRDRAPLTFAQVRGWRWLCSRGWPGHRTMARALRLCGPLNVEALHKSIEYLADRHEALRTQIVKVDRSPLQIVRQSAGVLLPVHDMTSLPAAECTIEAEKLFERVITEPIDLTHDPLFAAELARLGRHEHMLVLATDHIISDAISMNILVRDLFSVYERHVRGQIAVLPSLPVQYPDYAQWQQDTHDTWLRMHGAYWSTRFKGYARAQLPRQRNDDVMGLCNVPIPITADLRDRLYEWSRLRRTTVAMTVLTAYVALLMRLCRVSDIAIRYQSDGRADPKVENVVGFFASALYLRMMAHQEQTFRDLLNHVTEEYCNAYAHADFSWIETQDPQPDFTRCPGFSWIPYESGGEQVVPMASNSDLTVSLSEFGNPLHKKLLDSDGEISVEFCSGRDWLAGKVYFLAPDFSVEAMEQFGRNLVKMIQLLVGDDRTRLVDIDLDLI